MVKSTNQCFGELNCTIDLCYDYVLHMILLLGSDPTECSIPDRFGGGGKGWVCCHLVHKVVIYEIMCLRDAQALLHGEPCRKKSLQSCIANSIISSNLLLSNDIFVPQSK